MKKKKINKHGLVWVQVLLIKKEDIKGKYYLKDDEGYYYKALFKRVFIKRKSWILRKCFSNFDFKQ